MSDTSSLTISVGLSSLSLDGISDSTVSEFDYAPAALSDFTRHYCNASYHLHALVLIAKCKYFEAMLDAKVGAGAACTQTSPCQRPCITIEGSSIGGVTITPQALHEFFLEIYGQTQLNDRRCLSLQALRDSMHWRRRVDAGDFVEVLQAGKWLRAIVISRVLPNLTIRCEGQIQSAAVYFNLTSPCVMPPYTQKIGSTSDTAQSLQTLMDIVIQEDATVPSSDSLSDLPSYHLANYFDCSSLSLKHDKHHREIARKIGAQATRDYDLLWALLVKAERYHWAGTRSTCIDFVVDDKQCRTRPEWASHQASLSRETLAEMFVGAATR